MRRLEIGCRAATGFCLIAGVVGFALYILGSYAETRLAQEWLHDNLVVATEGRNRMQGYNGRLTVEVVEEIRLRDLSRWLAWYYSPLNLRYWAIALLYMTPALTMHLVARYVTWLRTEEAPHGEAQH